MESSASSQHSDLGEEGRRILGSGRALGLFAAFVIGSVTFMRLEALARADGFLLADSAQYVMMANELVTGGEVPVPAVRSVFFPILLALPLSLSRWIGGDGVLDPLLLRTVPYAFYMLAALGTYWLGRRLAGPWAGLLGVVLLAVQPELGYWSTDMLTDAPAAAAIVCGTALWLDKRPFAAGVALSTGVLLRYQSLITLGAFLLWPLVARRWKDLGRLLLGGVPAIVFLGLSDWLYWGAPFESFAHFAREHLGSFVPVAVVPQLSHETTPQYVASGAWHRYLVEAGAIFTWPVVAALLCYPIARSRLARPRAGDFALWILGATLAVLSLQRYKQERYLLAIAPLVAALAGVGAWWLALRLVRVLPRPEWRSGLLAGMLLAGSVALERLGWTRQHARSLQPFGAVEDAVQTIPAAKLPCAVALDGPWMLALSHEVRFVKGYSWYMGGIQAVRARDFFDSFLGPKADPAVVSDPRNVESIDYLIVPLAGLEPGSPRWTWINERTVLDGYFHDAGENQAIARFARSDAPYRSKPFRDLRDETTREWAPRIRFANGVTLVDVRAHALAPAPGATRVDFYFHFPPALSTSLELTAVVRGEHGATLVHDTFVVDPPGAELASLDQGGRTSVRESRYLTLPSGAREVTLRVGVHLEERVERGTEVLRRPLGIETADMARDEQGWPLLEVERSSSGNPH